MKFISLLFALHISLFGFSATYFVATTGNDNNSGGSDNPFRTIAKAAANVKAGDIVLISGGIYTEKSITPANSGLEGNYILFKSNSGSGNVVIKHPATTINDQTPVFQLTNKSYIWIEGLQFKEFKYGLASIYISKGNGNVIINNRFENLGNSEVAAWNGNQMIGVFNGTRNAISNNYFNGIIGDGINLNSQASENNIVSYNTFINFKGKLRAWGGSDLFSRAVDVQDHTNGNNVVAFNYAENVVHHVWLDRNGSNNIILRNYGNKGSGNVFNESRCAKNIIQENISTNMKVGYMSAYYETTNWTFDPRYVNNVAYNNQVGFNIHKSERDEFRNNICFNNTNYNIQFSAEALSNGPHIFKNNLWYTTSKANSVLFKGSATTVSNFQKEVAETGGLSVDPQFTSTTPGALDFTLQSSSPAKGAGDNGLDLGAFAFYPKSQFGWNSTYTTSDILVYFTDVISVVTRGSSTTLTLQLNKASSKQVTVDVIPVAGDAVIDKDIQLTSSTVTFQPGEISKTISIKTGNSAPHTAIVAFGLTNSSKAVAGGRILHVLRLNAGNAAPLIPVITSMESSVSTLEVYPNPVAEGTLHVKLEGNFQFKIIDVNGYTMEEGEAKDLLIVEKYLSPGVYVLHIKKNDDVTVYKFIKQ